MDIIGNFVDYLNFQRGFSPLTCSKYSEILSNWSKWWLVQAQEPPFRQLPCPSWSEDSLSEYFYFLRTQKNYQASSLAQTISCFKTLDKYLLAQSFTDRSMTSGFKTPKKDQNLIDFISQEILNQKFNIQELEGIELRRWTLFELFYGSGVRLAELHQVCWKDFQFHPPRMQVIGKGDKERIVPCTKRSYQLLAKMAYQQGFEFSEKALRGNLNSPFMNPKGETLSQRTLQNDIRALLESFGWQGKASPHMLRHSFATHMMENGAEISTLKELLGHTSIQSTQVYTHVSQDQVLKNFQQAHPRAKRKGPSH